MAKYVNNGPKRRIEKVWSRVSDDVTTAVDDTILHTAEDQKTLVRMIVQGNICPAGLTGRFAWRIVKAVATSVHGNPSVVEALDQDDNKLVLVRGTCSVHSSTTSTIAINIDSKAMRKIMVGDQIVMQTISSNDALGYIAVVVTMWFKE